MMLPLHASGSIWLWPPSSCRRSEKALHTYFFLKRGTNSKSRLWFLIDVCIFGGQYLVLILKIFFFSQASMWLIPTQAEPSYLLKILFFNVLIVSLPIGETSRV